MADLVRASSLVNIPELISELGGDPGSLLEEAGVSPFVVGDYNRFIPYSSLTTLVGRASEELGLPDFGLRVSRVQNLEMLGPIAVLARNADTVETALIGVIKYLHTYSPAIRADLRSEGHLARFSFAITPARMPYRQHLIELALGVILGMFRLLAGPGFRPLEVTFQHTRMSPTETYEEYFEAPIRFTAELNSLTFPARLLDRSIDGGDQQAHALARRFLSSHHRHLGVDEHVHELLDKLIPLGQADLHSIAAELLMHPRALQRRLAELGTSFEQIVTDWRRELAVELLRRPEMQLSEIAAQLGYAEQSVFTRSFRRWFGQTPLAYRRQLRDAGEPVLRRL
ncbi:AraC family transcriptional regulator [Dietzia sp. CH92]|uniref:AraC family transcriptional regulator n=1 Tax=Dietzia sp. CH92 TaxID=3051823 RepID=UPI0028D1F63D|nr:AraC family transcriptional regulator [Dietzia sp. CH92]